MPLDDTACIVNVVLRRSKPESASFSPAHTMSSWIAAPCCASRRAHAVTPIFPRAACCLRSSCPTAPRWSERDRAEAAMGIIGGIGQAARRPPRRRAVAGKAIRVPHAGCPRRVHRKQAIAVFHRPAYREPDVQTLQSAVWRRAGSNRGSARPLALAVQDRAPGNSLRLTHEFIAASRGDRTT